MLAAEAVGDAGAGTELAAGLLGSGMAAASHAAEAGTRAFINTSPEPFTNWTASIAKDVGVVAGLLVVFDHPLLFLGLLVLFLLLLVWLLPKLWRGFKHVFGTIAGWFGGAQKAPRPPESGARTPEARSPGGGCRAAARCDLSGRRTVDKGGG